jgi:hypothetical protein
VGLIPVTINGEKVKVIPGLTAVDVHGNLTNKGFQLEKVLDEEPNKWICTDNGLGYKSSVIASGKNSTEITSVVAEFVGDSNSLETGKEFLGYVGSIPYKNSDPANAKAWVMAHILIGGITKIGDVTFEVNSNGNFKSLKMFAAN